MSDRLRSRWIGYAVAVAATAALLGLRLLLWPVLGDAVPNMTFFPAVMIAAYYGGFGPGLLATLLGAVAADYFLVPPYYSFRLGGVNAVVAFPLFLLVGTFISGLCESLHRSRRRLVAEERERATAALRETEARFRQLAENIDEIFWITDTRFERTYYISPLYAQTWGRSCHSLYEQPRSWLDGVHPDDRAAVLENMQNCASGLFASMEYRVLRPDGSLRWVRSRPFAIASDDPAKPRIGGLTEDITERKQAEEALCASEHRFRAFVDHATDAFFLQDERLATLDLNRQACESLGYTREEMLGKTPHDFDPDVTPELMEYINRKLDDGGVIAFESRNRRKDGTVFPVEVRGQAFWDGDHRFTVASTRDITERKQAEEALRKSEARWRSLTEALPQLVWTALPDGTCDYFSSQWTEYTGIGDGKLLGWTWLETLHPDDREPTRRSWLAAVAGHGPYDVEYRVRRSDGAYRWFRTRGVPIRDGDGSIVKWFGTCTDIADLKQAEVELRRAKETAEAANRAKDDFLANVSHEIRTPMNAILGMTELTLDTALTQDQRESLKIVHSAADNLLGIINDVLDFSKIEAGKLQLDAIDFSLHAVLRDSLRALAIRAHNQGLELLSHVSPDVPDALVGDPSRLRQVLFNLIGNAIKFTPHGEVLLRVEAAGSPAPDEVELRFMVRDTGIGIDPDKQEKIFQAFEQEDTSTTRKYGGTGLGLTIAAQLVALMGGKMAVDSQSGRGSTFSFTARFSRGRHQVGPIERPLPGLIRNLRVLIVDDNATNRQILEGWLRSWQMEATAVSNGLAALDALWHGAASGSPYALMLLDSRMPDTDGLALAANIRLRAELARTRMILLTSGDRPGELVRSRELRIDARLLKPLQQDELLETIYQVIAGSREDRPAAVAATPAEPAKAAQPLRILVAEDNEFSAKLMERLLARRGHSVRLVHDGLQALKLLDAERFDLLLLDVHMPELDGFQVIQTLRQRELATGTHLTAIALTARSRRRTASCASQPVWTIFSPSRYRPRRCSR